MLLKFTPLPGQARSGVYDESGNLRFENVQQSITASSFSFVDLLQIYPDGKEDVGVAVYVSALSDFHRYQEQVWSGPLGIQRDGHINSQIRVPKRYFVEVTQLEFEQAVACATRNQTGIIDITQDGLTRSGIRGAKPVSSGTSE